MKRRYVLKNKTRFFTMIFSISIVLAVAFLASSAYGYEGEKYDTIKIQKGDTLWNVAGDYYKSGDIRKYIYEIKKANNLSDSMIYEGQELKIPLT
jgi:LysM repeat protein